MVSAWATLDKMTHHQNTPHTILILHSVLQERGKNGSKGNKRGYPFTKRKTLCRKNQDRKKKVAFLRDLSWRWLLKRENPANLKLLGLSQEDTAQEEVTSLKLSYPRKEEQQVWGGGWTVKRLQHSLLPFCFGFGCFVGCLQNKKVFTNHSFTQRFLDLNT